MARREAACACRGVRATHSGSNTRDWRHPAAGRSPARSKLRVGACRRVRFRLAAREPRVCPGRLRKAQQPCEAQAPRSRPLAAVGSRPWARAAAAALRARRRTRLQRAERPAATTWLSHSSVRATLGSFSCAPWCRDRTTSRLVAMAGPTTPTELPCQAWQHQLAALTTTPAAACGPATVRRS